MRAYLMSQGSDIWDICVHNTFVILPVAEHGPTEFERVSHLSTAREIWATLKAHHEGTAQVKARLYQTYRREYENFTQKPGESVEALFGHFQSIINKLRDNKAEGAQLVSDHEQALKVLHTLDPKIWEIKVSSIVESTSYDTLTISELFSKLKATEVDIQLRSNLTGSGSKSLALATPSVDPSAVSCAGFSLMSITEDQLELLGDDDLCLFNNRVRRVYDKRMFKRYGTKSGCFECGDPGHFIADRPKRSGYKKGTGSSFHDSGKHESPSFNKGKPKTRFFKKALKDYRRENKKRDKAFFAEMEKSYSKQSTTSSSSSSSSDEEIAIRKGKDKDDPAGLCFMAFGDKPKSHSHQRRRSRKSFYSMALGDREEKSSSDDSDDDDSKVSSYEREIVDLLESNRQELKYREKLLRGAKKRIDELESELAVANGRIESLSSSPCLGDSSECPKCEVLLCDLSTLKSRYTERVDERDALATELESAQLELKDAQATVVAPCVDCPSHLAALAVLKSKGNEHLGDLERLRAELAQTRLELETLN
ncbi:hypothetical protein GUJ93_ZPchr0003g16556 [Zizania palustris]|uniref:Uncharacterized protein n=1 Tax=Zizania palustris TaxID=103762 RepID=A0A8J5VCV0_ZIZPA|nr:hypothetical protein GUJ93_ZPchr0003g16556 [Zizania palustris]